MKIDYRTKHIPINTYRVIPGEVNRPTHINLDITDANVDELEDGNIEVTIQEFWDKVPENKDYFPTVTFNNQDYEMVEVIDYNTLETKSLNKLTEVKYPIEITYSMVMKPIKKKRFVSYFNAQVNIEIYVDAEDENDADYQAMEIGTKMFKEIHEKATKCEYQVSSYEVNESSEENNYE